MRCRQCGDEIPTGVLCRRCETSWAVGWVRFHLAQRLRLAQSCRGERRYIQQLTSVAAEVRQARGG